MTLLAYVVSAFLGTACSVAGAVTIIDGPFEAPFMGSPVGVGADPWQANMPPALSGTDVADAGVLASVPGLQAGFVQVADRAGIAYKDDITPQEIRSALGPQMPFLIARAQSASPDRPQELTGLQTELDFLKSLFPEPEYADGLNRGSQAVKRAEGIVAARKGKAVVEEVLAATKDWTGGDLEDPPTALAVNSLAPPKNEIMRLNLFTGFYRHLPASGTPGHQIAQEVLKFNSNKWENMGLDWLTIQLLTVQREGSPQGSRRIAEFNGFVERSRQLPGSGTGHEQIVEDIRKLSHKQWEEMGLSDTAMQLLDAAQREDSRVFSRIAGFNKSVEDSYRLPTRETADYQTMQDLLKPGLGPKKWGEMGLGSLAIQLLTLERKRGAQIVLNVARLNKFVEDSGRLPENGAGHETAQWLLLNPAEWEVVGLSDEAGRLLKAQQVSPLITGLNEFVGKFHRLPGIGMADHDLTQGLLKLDAREWEKRGVSELAMQLLAARRMQLGDVDDQEASSP